MLPYTPIRIGFIVLALMSALIADAFHIDIKPRTSLELNGQMITERNLHTFLEHHEKMLLFGHQKNGKNKKTFKLVDVQHKKRQARSTEPVVSLRISNEDDSNINLEFQKAKHLIDGGFVFIRRYENSSVLIKDFDKLAEKYSECFYRNENSALDVCDGNIRGVIHQNSTQYIIHPLPDRFGITSHIILEMPASSSSSPLSSSLQSSTPASPVEIDDSDSIDGMSFEPHMTEFEPSNDTLIESIPPMVHTSNIAFMSSILNQHSNQRRLDGWLRIPHSNNYSTKQRRWRRHIDTVSNATNVPVLAVEIAIFVDKDLYRHMLKNFPKNTEANLIRFVLAMINGVQLLYHHPSLGHKINFVLKRLEILHTDPKELRRSSDIDVFLNSFCSWQRKFNPASDADIVHFDHAVILTGLDLYVVAKNGKVSSQVVGLAPVAGMCTATSSCTINEGKHFESVFVVAHEIGHNLGMRHDTTDNNCDPSLYIMSPTLGSGKITWSKCSQNYLKSFLETSQAKCMFDHGQQDPALDHTADGKLPGERFDANQQCMLKYGKDSVRSKIQPLRDICRDLHCQRDRYTWTSHPALEGTICGDFKWCRSGLCILRSKLSETISVIPSRHSLPNKSPEKLSSLIDGRKSANFLKQDYNFNRVSMWSEWTVPSECESSCLFGESGRLREGSTGLRTFRRTCLDYRYSRKKCNGPDRKYEACSSKQCYKVSRTTITEFANQICDRAKAFDPEILKEGLQAVSANPDDSCKVFCKSKLGKPITKSWIFPDGTTCRNTNSNFDDNYYCINGRCEKFTCENSSTNYFKSDQSFCPENLLTDSTPSSTSSNEILLDEPRRGFKKYRDQFAPSAASLVQEFNRNESSIKEPDKPKPTANSAYSRRHRPTKENYRPTPTESVNALSRKSKSQEWAVKSGCHISCMADSKGIQIVKSNIDDSTNIQLCEADTFACDKVQNTLEYATQLCSRYQRKVRGLSGEGMQIAPSSVDPDRSCKVACQDEFLQHRFYLVNGENGYFPFGTKCSRSNNDNRYCVNGKCMEFDDDNVPLVESYISLALYRSKRSTERRDTEVDERQNSTKARLRRSFLYFDPINITETISPQLLQSIIDSLEMSRFERRTYEDEVIDYKELDLLNPIHISFDDY